MKIVIPMSGRGNRFVEAGYTVPKPLIEIDGYPIIEHIVNLFEGEKDFIFICSDDHLENTNMRNILERIAPNGKIIGIEPHKKGPVYAVTKAFEYLEDDEEVIVNYCDFSSYWDYNDFLKHTRTRDADGAIPSYKGFHPHMLGSTNYAFIRDENQWLLEIKEKEPFTDNRMNEYASNGTYYFKKAAYVKKYFQQLIEQDINLKGEYYVSLIYNLLQKDGLKISIYEIQHMLQWGTPQDVEQYLEWSNYFRNVMNEENRVRIHSETVNIIPLAGAGSRFSKEGYTVPKPLIEVSGKPMIIQASENLPDANERVFICLDSHLNNSNLEQNIKETYPNAQFVSTDGVTEGQAKTVELALHLLDLEKPALVSACDNGVLWNSEKYNELLADEEVDAIVWSFKNHTSSNQNPQMYGWVDVDESEFVKSVSVKKAISGTPQNDHAVVGTFYFKKAKYLKESIEMLCSKNIRVNGEFYLDSAVNELLNMDLKVKVFEVDQYICWGTPNDLKTYLYWQSFFHKCSWHPYTLEKDPYVSKEKIEELERSIREFKQEHE